MNLSDSFDKEGNFTILLKMQMIRYEKENNFSIKNQIALFKHFEIPLNFMCMGAFSGYVSYESKIRILREDYENIS